MGVSSDRLVAYRPYGVPSWVPVGVGASGPFGMVAGGHVAPLANGLGRGGAGFKRMGRLMRVSCDHDGPVTGCWVRHDLFWGCG